MVEYRGGMVGEVENEPGAPSAPLAVESGPLKVRRFGNYTLIKKIATGGMAEIWLATQTGIANFRRFVVIKKILSHLSEQDSFVQMFLDEARTCSQLQHPNIVQIYDLGRVGSTYFIAMEYIGGENLAALAWRAMKRGAPLAPQYAARIICDGSKALHYAHQMRGADGRALEIVHRDVSPQNILVTYEGEVKVVDFGIAKAATRSEQTRTGMLKGKFSYMSPEQCMGAPLDARSDVFALGIVLYEMVTGKRLFKHESELMILEMITRRSVVPPSQVIPNLPKALEAIIMRALDKELSTRFQSAQEMQLALEEYLRAETKNITSADLGTLVRALFSDKIEEKRKLIEAASKNELVYGAPEGDEENTDQKQPPRPGSQARGRQASQLAGNIQGGYSAPAAIARLQSTTSQMSSGYSSAGSMPHSMPGAMPPGYPGSQGAASHPGYPQLTPGGISYTGYATGPVPERPNWVARLLIVFALIVIGVAAYIVIYTRAPAPVPVKRGQLTIASSPQGARVFVDSKLVTDSTGVPILTPLTVKQLEYGQTYQLKLDLEGYRSTERPMLMADESNGREVGFQLDPLPGEILIDVRGESPETVTIYLGADRIGTGPSLRKSSVAGPVNISADAPGRSCTMRPAKLVLPPGKIERVEFDCVKRRSSPARPQPSDDPKRIEEPIAESPPSVVKAPAGGCTSDPSLPSGFLTLETKPFAAIYLNGKYIDETPVSRRSMPAGCVELKAVSHDKTKESVFRVQVQPGVVTVYRHEF
jgi:serine/threonine-protein kinase